MMLRKTLIGAVAVLAGTALVARAEPKDDLAAAARKLAEAENYSWTSTVQAGGPGGGTTEGKTQKDGLTWLSIGRQDNVTETYFKGEKGAVKTEQGWEALPEPGQGRGGRGQGGGQGGGAQGAGGARQGGGGQGGGGGGGGGGMRNPAMMIARTVRTFKSPAAQLEDLISKASDLKADGDAITGTLSEEAAKSLLMPAGGRGFGGGGMGGGRGRNRDAQGGGGQAGGAGGGQAGGGQGGPPDIKNAHGDVKFWTKDGTVTKYEAHVQGIVSFNGQDNEIDRTTTVEIKDVGSTKIDIPDEAKQKAGL